MFTWKRTLRTASSERFLAVREGAEAAAVDIHYVGHAAAGTVVLLDQVEWTDELIAKLLTSLDDDMLPGIDIDEGSVTFTVVRGHVVGNYEPEPKAADR